MHDSRPRRALSSLLLLAVTSLASGPLSAQTQLWIEQFGTPEFDRVSALAPDGAGGVFASGGTNGDLGGASAGQADAWLGRFDGSGQLLWVRQLGTGAGDEARSATSDGSGGVYITGGTNGSLGGPSSGSQDAWLARYAGDGTQLWVRQLGTGIGDSSFASASDDAGGVYLGGYTSGVFGGSGSGPSDPWVARYDPAGNQLWVRQLVVPGAHDQLEALAADGTGGVYACGRARGDLGGPNAGGEDAWVARYVRVRPTHLARSQSA